MTPALPDGFELAVLSDFAHHHGAAAAVVFQSARHLAGFGVPVTVFNAVGPIDSALAATPNLSVVWQGQEGIMHAPRLLRAFLRGVNNVPASHALRALPGRKNPARTVVHAHQWSNVLSPAVLAANRFLAHNRAGLHFRSGLVDSLADQLAQLRDAGNAARLETNIYDWYWQNPWTLSAQRVLAEAARKRSA